MELQPEAGDATLSTWNAELAFRSVVEATADKAGLDSMRHLVKNLAESLGVLRSRMRKLGLSRPNAAAGAS